MGKLGLFFVLILIVLLGLWVWAITGQNQALKERGQEQFTKQSDDRGDVIVQATPIELEPGKGVKFMIVLDTHSVELNYDLLKIASLSDDQGNNLNPVSWSGGSGGHHLSGELSFPPLSDKARLVELRIAGISNFDRKLIWNLS